MKTGNCLLALALFATGISAQPVESIMDRPLDLAQRWSFYRDKTVYVQHQCSATRAREIAVTAQKFFESAAAHLERRELALPLQLRIYADAEQYRRKLRFSRYREAHFNPSLVLVTAHCGISAAALEEQLGLFYLADAGLRTWQRLLLAEALPRFGRLERFRLKTDKPAKKRASLLQVLLSDHPLESHERQTLAALVARLACRGKLKDFLIGLYRDRAADGTGLDTLEALFPGIAGDILTNHEPDWERYSSPQ